MKELPKFYVPRKDFCGKMKYEDVVPYLMEGAFNKNGSLSRSGFKTFDDMNNYVPVTSKELFKNFIESNARHYFWSRCECEFIAIDWPYREEVKPERDGEGADLISINHPEKIDMYDILEPNLGLVTDLLWPYVEKKIK